jgi:hypothetical protein
MSWTVDQSGTTSALVIGTETQLGSNATTNATYVLKVNLQNMALGDVLEIRLYTKVLTGDTITIGNDNTLAFKDSSGPSAPFCQITISPPVPSDLAIAASLKQTAGTGRTFEWSLLRI